MKWIAVILGLANVMAYLVGAKIPPNEAQVSDASASTVINADFMTTIKPSNATNNDAVDSKDDNNLQENTITQLKVDSNGVVEQSAVGSGVASAQNSGAVLRQSAPATEQTDKKPVAVLTKPIVKQQVPNKIALTEAKAAPKPVPEPVETQVAKVAKPAAKPVLAPEESKESLTCYKVGPFTRSASLADMRDKLKARDIDFTVDQGSSQREIKAVRVYIGGFQNSAELNATKDRLVGLNIDHFVIRINGRQLLQVGYFSEPQRAEAYGEKLRLKGLDIKSDIIYRDSNVNRWLLLNQVASSSLIELNIPKRFNVQPRLCR